MNIKRAAYWGATGLVALAMAGSCVAYLSGAMTEELGKLGFQRDFALLLGAWKGAAAVALVAPAPASLQFLKEWCYAGLFFTFTGAAYFHLMAGDPLGSTIAPLVMGVLAGISWWLRSEVQRPEAQIPRRPSRSSHQHQCQMGLFSWAHRSGLDHPSVGSVSQASVG